ncbi:MAG: PSD1 and planctomycete cytochrome C domain-containing protein [Planctomycetota bacterium]|jgi:hypothetical protein
MNVGCVRDRISRRVLIRCRQSRAGSVGLACRLARCVAGILVCLVALTRVFAAEGGNAPDRADDSVSYLRQIKPILSNHCYACHGPDEAQREADLRLDVRDAAIEYAIVPGEAAESLVVDRIAPEDPDERMPPPDSSVPELTGRQIDLIRRWIDQGAPFDEHWAYVPPKRPAVPRVEGDSRSLNPIDRFIVAAQREQGFRPSPEAERRTLIRRLSFDLIGLPPKPDEIDAFTGDRSPGAYEKLVDRLLASPHYGERMAVYWLDVARYADTGGYHSDNHRDVWLYRDYVIDAFNRNLPFDQFTREQLAGDILPGATREQRIASGYNRLLQTTEEGGAQPKEYTAKYAADRVRNTASAWMGATLGCAECHDHKFDPYTTRSFYRFAAFFADVREKAVGRQGQTKMPDAEQTARVDGLARRIAELRKRQSPWTVLRPEKVESAGGTAFRVLEDGTVEASGENPDKDTVVVAAKTGLQGITAIRLDVLPDDGLPNKGPGRADNGNFVLNEVELTVDGRKVPWSAATASHSQKDHAVAGAVDGDPKTGWAILDQTGKANHAVLKTRDAVAGGTETTLEITLRHDHGGRHTIGRFRISAGTTPRAVEQELAELEKRKKDLEARVPTTLVSESVTPRVTRILPRGNWLDDSGEIVTPAVPAFLGPLAVDGRRPTRLDLANWLVAPEHPTVARVFVNRLWKIFFGQGLVKTLDDFGSQGELPTHPELLDWLAVELAESGWDVKHVVKLMVTSATYRQSSRATATRRDRDPANRWLARQSRFRIEAEMVRDNALAVSGLLSPKIGGQSVKPYQPAGYWAHLNFPKRVYQHDHGENQYRRGLYTYWQRTFLHPSLLAFDAPSREECTVDRPRSNTPLQALVLLNDPTYVEAARAFAARIVREAGSDEAGRLRFAFREALGRPPNPKEAAILTELYRKHRSEYADDRPAAEALMKVGESPPATDLDPAELAAWTSVARTVLNLHETITRY